MLNLKFTDAIQSVDLNLSSENAPKFNGLMSVKRHVVAYGFINLFYEELQIHLNQIAVHTSEKYKKNIRIVRQHPVIKIFLEILSGTESDPQWGYYERTCVIREQSCRWVIFSWHDNIF